MCVCIYIQKCCRERLAADLPWRVSDGEQRGHFGILRRTSVRPGGHGIPHWNLKPLVSYTWLVQTWLENPLPISSMIFPMSPFVAMGAGVFPVVHQKITVITSSFSPRCHRMQPGRSPGEGRSEWGKWMRKTIQDGAPQWCLLVYKPH